MKILQPPGWATPKGYANGVAARGTLVFVGGQTADDSADTGRVIALQVDHRDLLDDAGANLDFAGLCCRRRAGAE